MFRCQICNNFIFAAVLFLKHPYLFCFLRDDGLLVVVQLELSLQIDDFLVECFEFVVC